MYTPAPINPREAQDIAKRCGNEKLVFWTSVVSLGFMGVMAVAATTQIVFNMVRRGHRGRLDEPEYESRRGAYRGR